MVKHQLPPELVRTLAGIGSNLNQIARQINTASKAGRGDALLVATELLTQLTATERALNAVREVLRHDS